MIIINDEIKKFVNKKLIELLPKNSGSVIHGTFASGKSKYVSDIDLEVYLNYHNNIDLLVKDFQDLIKRIENDNDVFFVDSMVGLDKRYDDLDIHINKDLSFPNFNYVEYNKKLQKLHQNKIISKKEFNELSKYIVKNPSYMKMIGLKLFIEDNLKFIHWTAKQLFSGKKTYRKKQFNLRDVLIEERYPNIVMTIFRVSKDIYIPVDMSLLYYKGKNLFPKQQITISKEQYNVLKNSMVTDCVRYRDLYRFYYGMFKNYYQRKLMKCLKRLRTIISGIIYEKSIRNKNNMEVKRKMTKDFQKMKIIREEILDLNNTILGRLNQLKNQFSTLHDLVGLIPINDMIRIISIKINDINMCLEDSSKIDKSKLDLEIYINSNNINEKELKKKIKQLNKDIFNLLNSRSYPIFINYYSILKKYFPFKFNLKLDFKN